MNEWQCYMKFSSDKVHILPSKLKAKQHQFSLSVLSFHQHNRKKMQFSKFFPNSKGVFGCLDMHGWDGTLHGYPVFGSVDCWDKKIPGQGIYHKMLDFLVRKNLVDQLIHL